MKMLMIGVLTAVVVTGTVAQFKTQGEEQSAAASSLVRPASGISSFLGLLNAENFAMRHSLSYSYLSAGGTGLSIASYTNSIFYKIADPMNVRFDVTLQGTPFGAATPYQSALSGLFLSRAELNYRPWENFFVKVQYQRIPGLGFYNPWYEPYRTSSILGDE